MLHDLRTHSALVFIPYSPRNIQITDMHPKYSTGYIVKAFSESINLMLSIPPGPPPSEPPHSVRPLPINIYSIESKRRRPVIDTTTSPPSAVKT